MTIVGVLAILGFFISLAGLVYSFFKKKPKKKWGIGLVACFILFMIFVSTFSPPVKETTAPVSSESKQENHVSTEKSTNSAPTENKLNDTSSNKEKQNDDWAFTIRETTQSLTNKNNYPFVKNVSFTVDEDKKQITMDAVVDASLAPDKALDFAETMIRQFALFAPKDEDAPRSSKYYYGSIYDKYAILIGIAPSNNVKDTSKWYVLHYIEPGMHTKQAPKLQK